MSIDDGTTLHRLMASGGVPGIAAAIIRNGKLHRSHRRIEEAKRLRARVKQYAS